jgi:hypothetical protein
MQELLAVNFVVTSLKTLSSLSSLSDDEFKVLSIVPRYCPTAFGLWQRLWTTVGTAPGRPHATAPGRPTQSNGLGRGIIQAKTD